MSNVQLQFKKALPLEKVVEFLRKNTSSCDDNFCLYSKEYPEELTSGLGCCIEACQQVDENGEEVFPEFVVRNRLNLIYYGQQFADAVSNVLYQRSDASIQNIIDALNYYSKHDNFMNF